jgi:hypothetical protein
MIPLYTDAEFENCKKSQKLPLKCKQCDSTFYRKKVTILDVVRCNRKNGNCFCSFKCANLFRKLNTPTVTVQCTQCGNSKIIREKTFHNQKELNCEHFFCNHSCRALYTNSHKTYGYRRSKLEKWLEPQLQSLYPTLEIHFNRKDTINSELDIYIPSLRVAFELNGIFHYEPIYSSQQLQSIQNNDGRKFQACIERGIELCIIDTSKQARFTEKTSLQYLDIITNIISQKMATQDGYAPSSSH